jgi:hypothetical protein
MQKLRLSIVLITSISLLGACAISQIVDEPTQDETKKIVQTRAFEKKYDAVWSATIKTLATSGYSIQSQDKSSGNISTDYMLVSEAIGIFTTGNRYRLNVIVERKSSSQTEVTIVPSFEIRVADTANWRPTGRKRPQMDVEKAMFDGIRTNL